MLDKHTMCNTHIKINKQNLDWKWPPPRRSLSENSAHLDPSLIRWGIPNPSGLFSFLPLLQSVCPLSSPIEGARLLLPQWESPDQTERIWTSLMLIPSEVHISFAYLLFSAKSNLIMSLNVCTLCTTVHTVRLQKRKNPLCWSELPFLFCSAAVTLFKILPARPTSECMPYINST